MRTLAFLSILVALVAASGLATAQSTFVLEAHDSYFMLQGGSVQKPVLAVEPGAEVTVTLKNVGNQPHNWQMDNVEGAEMACCLMSGEERTVTFTAPETAGDYEYYCLPHKAQGMTGTLRVQAAGADDGSSTTPPPADGGSSTPASGLLGVLAVVGAALVLLRRRA